MTETVGCISIKAKVGQNAEHEIKEWLWILKQGEPLCKKCPEFEKKKKGEEYICYGEKLHIIMCSSISGYFDFQLLCRTQNGDMSDIEKFVQYCIRNCLSEYITDTQTILGIEIP
ncbi:MAG: hypothetical protein QMC80_07505 [Thermoplasmatales archaeon]|nr:hypothetical protein [Thermoplasmatales archaeon]